MTREERSAILQEIQSLTQTIERHQATGMVQTRPQLDVLEPFTPTTAEGTGRALAHHMITQDIRNAEIAEIPTIGPPFPTDRPFFMGPEAEPTLAEKAAAFGAGGFRGATFGFAPGQDPGFVEHLERRTAGTGLVEAGETVGEFGAEIAVFSALGALAPAISGIPTLARSVIGEAGLAGTAGFIHGGLKKGGTPETAVDEAIGFGIAGAAFGAGGHLLRLPNLARALKARSLPEVRGLIGRGGPTPRFGPLKGTVLPKEAQRVPTPEALPSEAEILRSSLEPTVRQLRPEDVRFDLLEYRTAVLGETQEAAARAVAGLSDDAARESLLEAAMTAPARVEAAPGPVIPEVQPRIDPRRERGLRRRETRRTIKERQAANAGLRDPVDALPQTEARAELMQFREHTGQPFAEAEAEISGMTGNAVRRELRSIREQPPVDDRLPGGEPEAVSPAPATEPVGREPVTSRGDKLAAPEPVPPAPEALAKERIELMDKVMSRKASADEIARFEELSAQELPSIEISKRLGARKDVDELRTDEPIDIPSRDAAPTPGAERNVEEVFRSAEPTLATARPEPAAPRPEPTRAPVESEAIPVEQEGLFKTPSGDASVEVVRPTGTVHAGVSPIQPLGSVLQRELARATARAETPAIRPPTMADVIVGVERAPKAPGVGRFIATPTNYLGAIPGQKPRFGWEAKTVARHTALAERDIKVEVGVRDEFVQSVRHSVPKEDYGETGELFIQAFEGRPIKDILADPKLSAETKSAMQELRSVFDADRIWMRDYYRDNNRSWVTRKAEHSYRQENKLEQKRLTRSDRAKIEKKADDELMGMFPDEWGVLDYFPHMFPGRYFVKARNAEGDLVTIGSTKNPMEAMAVIADHAVGSKLEATDFMVVPKIIQDPDIIRLSGARFRALSSDMQSAAGIGPEAISEALRGKISTRLFREKFWANNKKRKGAEGYSRDFGLVMQMYNRGIARFRHLTRLNQEVQPLIEDIRATGNSSLANYVEGVFNQAWGAPRTQLSEAIDNSLLAISGARDLATPFLLERWTARYIKAPVATLKWKLSPRGQALNLMQTFQTTLATVDNLEFASGVKFFASKTGREALQRHGVRFFSQGRFGEGGPRIIPAAVKEKASILAPETFNQEMAWSILYNKGAKAGLDDAAAADYAFLRGNVFTQFTHLRSDLPPILRGPVLSTIFMFKRFPIKNIELGLSLVKDKNYAGSAKWLTSQLLLGGSMAFTRPLGVGFLTKELYDQIRDEHGDGLANTVAYGLPGLLGLDMSYSIQMLDVPFGETLPEKIGNALLGPAAADAVRIATAVADKKGNERSAFMRGLRSFVQSNPALRWIETIEQIHQGAEDGLYDFRTPSGKLRYRGDLKDAILRGLGGKTIGDKVNIGGEIIDLGSLDIALDGYTEIQAKRSEAIDDMVLEALNGRDYDELMGRWDELYPEFWIRDIDVESRMMDREENLDRTVRERVLRQTAPVIRQHFNEPGISTGVPEPRIPTGPRRIRSGIPVPSGG